MVNADSDRPDVTGLVRATIDKLRAKLIDLTMANRLLNFKPSEKSKTHILIIDEVPEALFEKLEAGKELEFAWIEEPDFEPANEGTQEFINAFKQAKKTDSFYQEHLEKLGKRPSRRQISNLERMLKDRVRTTLGLDPHAKPSVADRARELGIDPSYDLPQDSDNRSHAHSDSKIQTLLYRENMEAKLSAIREGDKTLLDDAGVNALYTAFGEIEWYESSNSNIPIFAPALFLPVEIRRILEGGVYRFVLVLRDDDIETNQAFAELIKATYSLELPQWKADGTIAQYFAEIEHLVQSQRRWRLRRRVTVGLFTFAKIAMYRDLDTKRWLDHGGLESHTILSDLLAGTETIPEISLAKDYEIDSPSIAKKCHILVTDADSSQHSALIDVLEGKNLVVQGPPGTGKSQTITNMIAAAMNEGKRILFVAEKMAALKVVKDRLDSFGLGHFCLEVHSNKTRKTSVLKSLQDRLNLFYSWVEGKKLRQTLESHELARAELIHYAGAMNEQVGETDLSVHEVLRANCTRVKLGEELPAGLRKARIADPTKVSDGTRAELRDLANDLQTSAASVDRWGGLVKHPWRGLGNENLDVFQLDELQSELDSWCEALEILRDKIAEISNTTGWGIEGCAASAARFVTTVLALPETPSDAVVSIGREAATDLGRSLIQSALKNLDKFAFLTERLAPVFADPKEMAGIEVASVKAALDLSVSLGVQGHGVGEIEGVQAERQRYADRLRDGLDVANHYAQLFSINNPCVSDIEGIITAVALLSDIPKELLRMRDPILTSEATTDILEQGLKEGNDLRNAKAIVIQDFRLVSLPATSEIKHAAHTMKNAGLFARLFDSNYKNARKLYESIAQLRQKQRKRDAGGELARLAKFLDQKTDFENNLDLRKAAGLTYRGMDTPWRDLITVSRWATKVRRELPRVNGELNHFSILLLAGETTKLQTIVEHEQKGHRIDALKVFMEADFARDRSLAHVSEVAETVAASTRELALNLRRLRINPNVVISNLEAVVPELIELREADGRLRAADAYTLLLRAGGSRELASPILKDALKFAEDLFKVDLPQHVRAAILEEQPKLTLEGLRAHANAMLNSLNVASSYMRTVSELASLNPQEWIGKNSLEDAPIAFLIDRINYACAYLSDLQPYLDFLRREHKAESSHLRQLLKHLEGAVPPYSQLGEVYDFIFFRSCAESILSKDPKLRSHSGATHEQLRKRYQQLDRKLMELRRLEIACKLTEVEIPAGNNRGRASEITELALIRRQIGLQRRHIALRDLFKRAGHAIQALKPCFMMSPMSVAQFLDPGGLRFDLVLMDEASQIRPEDALGAIARGGQLVVVGDPKQLPPTTFFEKVDRDDIQDDNSEEADIHDLTSQESILDLARGPYQPVRQLRWHYRSQHERLIAFSNHEFYDDTLIVFPSPKGVDLEYGVKFIAVDGAYGGGVNPREAEAIIEAAQQFMRQFPSRSLGIVAMNKPQQELIQKMMDELFATDVESEAYRLRWEGSLDSLFVKNLENVQGDERDVIFISTVYGKDEVGNFFQRFGPINGAYGHRRLNVLFTRAKQQVRLFTSMRPSEIRVDESSRLGVKALKNYLTYAQEGHLSTVLHTGREPDSEFESWVMQMLHESGYETVPQLGVAGYFIDLAVRHPDQSGSFILGIECDGAMYHSARSVRDRDRLRQEVLERLRWKIYRIWSTDWFRNPRAEYKKLVEAIEALRATKSAAT
jgi:very-short-patch-repair endonuclease